MNREREKLRTALTDAARLADQLAALATLIAPAIAENHTARDAALGCATFANHIGDRLDEIADAFT